jgi:hypothetical protein
MMGGSMPGRCGALDGSDRRRVAQSFDLYRRDVRVDSCRGAPNVGIRRDKVSATTLVWSGNWAENREFAI